MSIGRRLLGALSAVLALSTEARAGERDALLLPTEVRACADCPPEAVPTDPELPMLARRLDSILAEAALDLGLSPDVADDDFPEPTEAALVEAAQSRWVFAPRLAFDEGALYVRLTTVAPGASVLLVRAERTAIDELEMAAAVMMRDIVRAGRHEGPTPAEGTAPKSVPRHRVEEVPSEGRAVLAFSGAALGGYIGFALQRAGGSSDARLTFPLIALGTGVGLGASMLVAEEWDIGVGDAWYLAAGTWWPTASALLLTESYDQPSDSRYVYSLGATAGGVALSTIALSVGHMSSGGAVLAHSGGAYGTLVGGLSQMLYEGRTGFTPTRGMGLGAGIGVLSAGIAARLVPIQSASRVLLVDLGAGLGGLVGAAASSPIVFSDTGDRTRNRLFLSSIGAGMVTGAVISYVITDGDSPEPEPKRAPPAVGAAMPWAGPLPVLSGTAFGGGLQGTW